MRVFAACLVNETNVFAPFPVNMSRFESGLLYGAGAPPPEEASDLELMVELRRRGRAGRLDLVEGTCAAAEPAGLVVRACYEALRDRILNELAEAGHVDAVALQLHGAMIADGYEDCEGDLLSRVRAIVGPGVPIGALLDPHAHLTPAMLAAADLLIAAKEYPHVDFADRARELLDLLAETAAGRLHPVMRAWDTGTIGVFHTSLPAVRPLIDQMMIWEAQLGVLSCSLIHGFPFGDAEALGTRSLVITDGNAELADQLARELAAIAAKTGAAGFEPPTALDEAIDIALAAKGPVVMADSPDNPGGGAAGDATYVLRRLIERDVSSACLGGLWDPLAVGLAFDAGVGARMQMRIGGKLGSFSGQPLDAEVEILALDSEAVQTFAGSTSSIGRAAAVRIGGVEVVLQSARAQTVGPDLFTRLGIDPADRKIVVVKSSRHFEAGFGPLASRILTLECPGSLQFDFSRYPYRRVSRPRWPIDPEHGALRSITGNRQP